MTKLVIHTKINAAPDVCFDLVRRAGAEADENQQIVKGEFTKGQTVTFRSSFLGLRRDLIVEVKQIERPKMFVDEMTTGVFTEFRHVHEFIPQDDTQTLLKDTFEWTSPLGIIGRFFDELFIKKRLEGIVRRRNSRLKEIAENGGREKEAT